MLKDVLYAAGVCNEYEYNFTGHGAQKAVARIVEAIEANYHYWLVFDIKNCFASLKLEHLQDMMPTPGTVMKGVAFLPPSIPILCSSNKVSITLEQAARRGLPQGSISSAPLASALLGREIRSVMAEIPGSVALSFGDDVAFGARTQAQTHAVEKLVGERLSSLSGGPLFLKFLKLTHANAGLDFIQRRVQRRWCDEGYEVRVRPSQSAFTRLERRLRTEFDMAELCAAFDQPEGAVRKRIRNWAGAMGWKMPPDWDETVLTSIIAHS